MYVWVFSGHITSFSESEDMYVEHIGDFVYESMTEPCACPQGCVPASSLIFAGRGFSTPFPLEK